MKLPRDCNGADLVRALRQFGYEVRRQTGSHVQLATERGGEHHLSVPNHRPLKVGMLSSLLKDIAAHHGVSVDDLLQKLCL